MAKREDLTGQIFGTRKVIKNYCEDEDWIKINKPIPKEKAKFRLTQCLNCGAILPGDPKNLKKNPPKKCVFCSNIGNHYNIKTNTNNWSITNDNAICNVTFKNQIVSFYIDKEDYKQISQYIWRIVQKKQKYYVITGSNKKGTDIYLHHMFLPEKDNLEVDHIDGNSLNNRKSNLRYTTHQENVDNVIATRIDNQIGIRGVSYNSKAKIYKVDFIYHNKRYYFKDWNTIEEAIYCRLCCEQYFNLSMLEKNPNLQYYDFSKVNKEEIHNYVLSKISGN